MTTATLTAQTLAIKGGPKAVEKVDPTLFAWPIVTKEDEEAVLDVVRRGAMSSNDISKLFEADFAKWMGTKYCLSYPSGTSALQGAFWACGIGAGDEVICAGMTYWASCTSILHLGAAVNFADVEFNSLCIDPNDIEHRIGPKTRAIIVVHYAGYPADMDRIMAIARKHNVKVIEDCSHAHGTLYKGRKVGTIGDIAAMSCMSGKSFAIGEAGVMVTNNEELYERCIAYGFYERTGGPSIYAKGEGAVSNVDLSRFKGVPVGGQKHRMNQTCAAMGRVQLKSYDQRAAEIQKALNRFWDLLEGVPGLRAHRPAKGSGSTMGGWYASRGLYVAKELGGLPIAKFCEAVSAEGVPGCGPGANFPLHTHAVFHDLDLFHQGKPTMIAFGQRDVRQGKGTLPVTESIHEIAFGVPWFKHDRPEEIERYAAAYRKVAQRAEDLK
ncbi:MAG: DegT/DnrJ/EryC1/StrS family aminotransferase [Planctomycetes bacterium]|nr:DegT/DnrJ/EryC1/StrS family aminotransferase [Planctomycetota bacterium]